MSSFPFSHEAAIIFGQGIQSVGLMFIESHKFHMKMLLDKVPLYHYHVYKPLSFQVPKSVTCVLGCVMLWIYGGIYYPNVVYCTSLWKSHLSWRMEVVIWHLSWKSLLGFSSCSYKNGCNPLFGIHDKLGSEMIRVLLGEC